MKQQGSGLARRFVLLRHVELGSERFFNRVGHACLECCQQSLKRERPQPLQRGAHLRPSFGRPTCLLERLPHVAEETIWAESRGKGAPKDTFPLH